MIVNSHAYNISVRRDTFDGVDLFEARVKELPDVVEYGETYSEAYELAIDTIETAAAAYKDQGRAFPNAQVPVDDYSGRVTLRVPRSLHRGLSEMAEAEGVSLNQHIVNVLNYYSGYAAGNSVQAEVPWKTISKTTKSTGRPTHLRIVQVEKLAESEKEAA